MCVQLITLGDLRIERPDGTPQRIAEPAELVLERARSRLHRSANTAQQRQYQRHFGEQISNVFTGSMLPQVKDVDSAIATSQSADQMLAALPGLNETQRQAFRRAVGKQIVDRLEQVANPDALQKYLDAVKQNPPVKQRQYGGVAGVVANAADEHGVDPRLLLKITGAESGNNPRAKNPRSSARGLGQFINSTARKYGLRNDGTDSVERQADAVARLTRDNITAMAGHLRRPPSPGEVYLAHFAGIGGAKKVLSASGKTMVSHVLGNQVVAANKFLKNKTVAWMRAWADKKMSGAVSPVGKNTQNTSDYYVTQELNRRLPKIMARAEKTRLVQSIISGETQINPADREMRKIADSIFDDDQIERLMASGDEKLMDQVMRVAERQKYVPEPVFEALRGYMLSDDPRKQVMAYTLITNISERAPHALGFHGKSREMKEKADQFAYFVQERLMTPEQALKEMKARETPEWRKLVETRKKELKESISELEMDDVIGEFDTWLPFDEPDAPVDPVASAVLMGDYRDKYRDYFNKSGDPEQAKVLALRELRKIYGVSSITGESRVTRYPPENYYPPIAGSHEYIERQFKRDIGERLGEGWTNVSVQGDRDTARKIARGERPDYIVTYTDENGLRQIAGRWAPDPDRARRNFKDLNAARRKLEMEGNKDGYMPPNLLRRLFGHDVIYEHDGQRFTLSESGVREPYGYDDAGDGDRKLIAPLLE